MALGDLRIPNYNLLGSGLLSNQQKGTKRKKFSRTDEKAIYSKHKGKCAICKRKTEFFDGEIDHKKALAKGGSNSAGNLQWLCHRCNKLKGSIRTNAQVKKLLGLKDKTSSKKKTTKRKPKKPSPQNAGYGINVSSGGIFSNNLFGKRKGGLV